MITSNFLQDLHKANLCMPLALRNECTNLTYMRHNAAISENPLTTELNNDQLESYAFGNSHDNEQMVTATQQQFK